MISPADMPRKRPEHTFRPPPAKRVPEWHCSLQVYRSHDDADRALGHLWQTRRGGLMEAHPFQCRRHGNREVWHLSRTNQEGRAS